MNFFKRIWNKITGRGFKFTQWIFVDPNKKSPYLEKCMGKKVRVKNDAGIEVEVVVKHMAHSFKHPDRAVINGDYFITYFDLFNQVEDEGDPTEEEWEALRKEFESLKPEQQRAILGFDNKLAKYLKR